MKFVFCSLYILYFLSYTMTDCLYFLYIRFHETANHFLHVYMYILNESKLDFAGFVFMFWSKTNNFFHPKDPHLHAAFYYTIFHFLSSNHILETFSLDIRTYIRVHMCLIEGGMFNQTFRSFSHRFYHLINCQKYSNDLKASQQW